MTRLRQGRLIAPFAPNFVHQRRALGPGAGRKWHGMDRGSGRVQDVELDLGQAIDLDPFVGEVGKEYRDVIVGIGSRSAPGARAVEHEPLDAWAVGVLERRPEPGEDWIGAGRCCQLVIHACNIAAGDACAKRYTPARFFIVVSMASTMAW